MPGARSDHCRASSAAPILNINTERGLSECAGTFSQHPGYCIAGVNLGPTSSADAGNRGFSSPQCGTGMVSLLSE